MNKIAKYLTILIIGIAVIFGAIKLAKKEELQFIKPQKISVTPSVDSFAHKKDRNTIQNGDTKTKIALFASNYLVVKVPKNALPQKLIYNNHSYPLHKVKEEKNFILLATPIIKTPIRQKHVPVKLLYKKKSAYIIPLDALITYGNKNYLLVKNGKLQIVEANIIKIEKQKNYAVVKNNLEGKEIAIGSQKRLEQELLRLLHTPTKSQVQPK
ncbi:hypothetical protein NitYY0826_C0091 [Nitratiruptor sp. YY08-26]|uniref:hypothetical protein n=1 Tax=unclassified Nitratiruptor TaxID=2624044 RepID=UPI00191501F1|nr:MULTISPECIES: hypothetical protein [unclassified Nitratiruptor]BCD61257.1 hypothetical protein NitYY0813_C0091 [Nitratiruptor sp. YY08-13]BCD65190.1 hypothetical protein NitYY0826_C0091 [Nitratiruptor sp. YY08-26]